MGLHNESACSGIYKTYDYFSDSGSPLTIYLIIMFLKKSVYGHNGILAHGSGHNARLNYYQY